MNTRPCDEADFDRFFEDEALFKVLWPFHTCLDNPEDYVLKGSHDTLLTGGENLLWEIERCTGFDYCRQDEEIDEFIKSWNLIFVFNL